MPISQNKLMPYSDNPARILENDMQHRRSNRDAPTRKNGSSTRFRPKKFFQKWIMSSTYLKLPGQQHAMYIHPNDSNNHSSRFPVKIRPAFCIITVVNIIILAIIGFSRTSQSIILPKNLFHFFGFALITSLFYSIPDIEDSLKVIWYWNYFNEILTGFVCFFLGGFGSEFIQLFLPWKVFSWGDLLANELGCLTGYQLSRSLHRRYRSRLELSSLYEPLGASGSSSRDLDLSSEQDDEENLNDRQQASNATFNVNDPELANVWSDRVEEGEEYFRFEEDED